VTPSVRLPASSAACFDGSVDDAYDDALCESFFATLGCELLYRRRFRAQVEARLDLTPCWRMNYSPATVPTVVLG
jgi:hypothetical protein